MGQTTPSFNPSLHLDLNYTPVKFCFLHFAHTHTDTQADICHHRLCVSSHHRRCLQDHDDTFTHRLTGENQTSLVEMAGNDSGSFSLKHKGSGSFTKGDGEMNGVFSAGFMGGMKGCKSKKEITCDFSLYSCFMELI